jgi:hypothetical protein
MMRARKKMVDISAANHNHVRKLNSLLKSPMRRLVDLMVQLLKILYPPQNRRYLLKKSGSPGKDTIAPTKET